MIARASDSTDSVSHHASRNKLTRPSEGVDAWGGKTLSEPNTFLSTFLRLLEARLGSDDLSVQQIAGALHLSRSHLHRKLKVATGKSFTQIVQELKMARAKLLLTSSDYSVGEIAHKLGYKDQSYFTKVFKRIMGTTPSSLLERRKDRDRQLGNWNATKVPQIATRVPRTIKGSDYH